MGLKTLEVDVSGRRIPVLVCSSAFFCRSSVINQCPFCHTIVGYVLLVYGYSLSAHSVLNQDDFNAYADLNVCNTKTVLSFLWWSWISGLIGRTLLSLLELPAVPTNPNPNVVMHVTTGLSVGHSVRPASFGSNAIRGHPKRCETHRRQLFSVTFMLSWLWVNKDVDAVRMWRRAQTQQ